MTLTAKVRFRGSVDVERISVTEKGSAAAIFHVESKGKYPRVIGWGDDCIIIEHENAEVNATYVEFDMPDGWKVVAYSQNKWSVDVFVFDMRDDDRRTVWVR